MYITSSDIIFVIVISANKLSSLSVWTVVLAIPLIYMNKFKSYNATALAVFPVDTFRSTVRQGY